MTFASVDLIGFMASMNATSATSRVRDEVRKIHDSLWRHSSDKKAASRRHRFSRGDRTTGMFQFMSREWIAHMILFTQIKESYALLRLVCCRVSCRPYWETWCKRTANWKGPYFVPNPSKLDMHVDLPVSSCQLFHLRCVKYLQQGHPVYDQWFANKLMKYSKSLFL